MSAEAEASEVAAAAALISAVHEVTLEMPEVCTVTACCLLFTRFAIWYFADLCRSPPHEQQCPRLHMQRDLKASNPRVRRYNGIDPS